MIYVDSNALIYLLHDIRPKSSLVAKYLVEHEEIFTSLRTIEEASYIIIRVKASKPYGARGVYDIRRIVDKHGLDFARNELEVLRKLIEENDVVVLQDVATVEEIHKNYGRVQTASKRRYNSANMQTLRHKHYSHF